jgi:sensor histidine kinase YesM
MASKRYSDKELQVFVWVILPYITGMNSILFEQCVFTGFKSFIVPFFLSAAYLFAVYFIFGLVAVLIQRRFPASHDLFRRIGVMLPVFYLMNVLLVTGIYDFYRLIRAVDCTPISANFWGAVAFGCLASTVITFLNEGIVNWDKWKASVTETEQLKNAYQKTRLLGLKGQINPHFLFNCFNSLSSLINEDEGKAVRFLDEMTKVHRYMLRGADDQLVSLDDELKFANSYLFLTNVRFGEAIKAAIEVGGNIGEKFLPPLSLQVILENIIYTNTASKSSPLSLSITAAEDGLVIRNTVRTRDRVEATGLEEGLDNLITKYRLLHVSAIRVEETSGERKIFLPLMSSKEAGV